MLMRHSLKEQDLISDHIMLLKIERAKIEWNFKKASWFSVTIFTKRKVTDFGSSRFTHLKAHVLGAYIPTNESRLYSIPIWN